MAWPQSTSPTTRAAEGPGERIDHERDQRAVAPAGRGGDIDRIEQPPRLRVLEFSSSSSSSTPRVRAAPHARAAGDFLAWVVARGVKSLAGVQPLHVAAWVEVLEREVAAPNVKQPLAAVKHLFDWLVTGRIMPVKAQAACPGLLTQRLGLGALGGVVLGHWNDIRSFLAVARSRSFSQAGQRTGSDHATVGRRMSSLESALGLQLFERNPRGYILAQRGEALLGMATAPEAEAVRIEEAVAGHLQGITGAVRISVPEGFGTFFLASRIGAPAAAHPSPAVEMIAIQQIVALSRREADVAITMTVPPTGNFAQDT